MQIFNLFRACGYIHSDKVKSFLSREFVSFMHKLRIPTNKTSVYHPPSNGQCEKYNDVIWSDVKLALKEQNLSITKWENVLPQVLHYVRSLLCTTTNTTPHERFLNFQRRSVLGIPAPSWLSSTGTVLVRRHNRQSKYDSLVEEADLIHATRQYAHVRVRFRNGRETTVSLRNVASLCGTEEPRLTVPPVGESSSGSQFVDEAIPYEPLPHRDEVSQNELETSQTEISHDDSNSFSGSAADDVQPVENNTEQPVSLRRSTQTRKPPERLIYYE